MLSHAVMSVVQVFPSLCDVEYGLCLCERRSSIRRDVIWPWWGSMLWFEQGWDGGDGWILSGDVVCHVRICQGLNLRSRHPMTTCATRVQYGTTCLVIRYAIGCVVLCWVGMAPVYVTHLYNILCELPEPHGAKGGTVCGKPQHCKRGHYVWETVAKHDILL
jgi:hypothetical protein